MIQLSFTLASLSVLLSWLCYQEALEEYPYFHQEQRGDESFCYVRMSVAVVCCRLSRFTLLGYFMQV